VQFLVSNYVEKNVNTPFTIQNVNIPFTKQNVNIPFREQILKSYVEKCFDRSPVHSSQGEQCLDATIKMYHVYSIYH
jgi:hypothetical protein